MKIFLGTDRPQAHVAKWHRLETGSGINGSVYKPRQMFKGRLRHKAQMAVRKPVRSADAHKMQML